MDFKKNMRFRIILLIAVMLLAPALNGCHSVVNDIKSIGLEHNRRYHSLSGALKFAYPERTMFDPEELSEYLELNRNKSSKNLNDLAVCYDQLADTDRAYNLLLDLYNKKQKPDFSEFYENLAFIAARNHNWQLSANAYRTLIELNILNREALMKRVLQLESSRNLILSTLLAESLAEHEKDYLEPVLWLARRSLQHGKLKISQQYFQAVINQNPPPKIASTAWEGLATISKLNKDNDEALYYLYAAAVTNSNPALMCGSLTETLLDGANPGHSLALLMQNTFASNYAKSSFRSSLAISYLKSIQKATAASQKENSIIREVENYIASPVSAGYTATMGKSIYSNSIIAAVSNNPLDTNILLLEGSRACSTLSGNPEMVYILGKNMLEIDYRTKLNPLKKLIRNSNVENEWTVLENKWYGISPLPESDYFIREFELLY